MDPTPRDKIRDLIHATGSTVDTDEMLAEFERLIQIEELYEEDLPLKKTYDENLT